MERWHIEIDKDYLKFSAAHFLIFPDGTAERLHGHNYRVHVEVHGPLDAFGLVLNFSEVKPLVRELVDELDECLLLPGAHPVLRAEPRGDGQVEVRYRDRYYLLPQEDVRILPINNTSAENLAAHLGQRLLAEVQSRFQVEPSSVVVGVEETPGQRGVYRWER